MKPLMSVSMDLDNQWSYMKTHGDAGWEQYPSYLDTLLPYCMDVLADQDLCITFFIVGKDAAQEPNRPALALIPEHGHTVGNHSFHHEPWLHLYERSRIEDEIDATEAAIHAATGLTPRGFRGPGFSWSETLLQVLTERGYEFDASTLPTYIGPLARMYYFWSSSFSRQERDQRKTLFGTIADGRRKVKPYEWHLNGKGQNGRNGHTHAGYAGYAAARPVVIGTARESVAVASAGATSPGNHTAPGLLEIPVTTIPVVKLPFHLSYLLYLSRFSRTLMMTYLRTAIAMCRATGTEPSFLLHPLDLLGGDQVPELAFFPGMDLSAGHKLEVFTTVMHELTRHFQPVDMYTHARAIHSRMEGWRPVGVWSLQK